MDPFKQRLKQDARNIETRPPQDLAAQVIADVQGQATPDQPGAQWQWPRFHLRSWFVAVAGLTGFALLLRISSSAPEPEVFETTPPAQSASVEITSLGDIVLRARRADFDSSAVDITDPLNKELQAIQADLATAAENAREDLRFMF